MPKFANFCDEIIFLVRKENLNYSSILAFGVNAYVIHKGVFTNYVDKILAFFDHLPPSVDIFYGMNVENKWTFLDYLPTLSCKRSL